MGKYIRTEEILDWVKVQSEGIGKEWEEVYSALRKSNRDDYHHPDESM